ncbi:helix-turn-helix domain-containing protein [Aquimarina sp. 2304DJ70-9]|uniref:helix-turn-helix domain-containing protein n=1 Tax=Aquimarina penaris TaxID=3231044 RepID=UPI0034628123
MRKQVFTFLAFITTLNYFDSTFYTASKTRKGIVSSIMVLIIIGILTQMQEYHYAYIIFTLLSTCIYWIGYVGLHKPTGTNEFKSSSKKKIQKKTGFYTYYKINQYIITNEKYLSPNMSLNSIASYFNMSKNYISQLINTHAEKSFNDYINELRVEASQKMLLDEQYDHYTIESIGLECGFTSKSNFYTAFKKITGQTPNQYKKLEK